MNNPPPAHQTKKRRKALKGVSFWLETEERKRAAAAGAEHANAAD